MVLPQNRDIGPQRLFDLFVRAGLFEDKLRARLPFELPNDVDKERADLPILQNEVELNQTQDLLPALSSQVQVYECA